MPIRPDLVVFSKQNEPRLVVEVTNKLGASADWARQFRRNLLAHGGFPRAPYFLLVTPERLYLWHDPQGEFDVAPVAEASTRDTLRWFFETRPAAQVDEGTLELMTHAWLSILAAPTVAREDIETHHRWLVDAGLVDSIRGGHVELEPAA